MRRDPEKHAGIAIQWAKAEVEPIPLDPDGSKKDGTPDDYMRLIGVAAARANGGGKTLDAERLAARGGRGAHDRDCDPARLRAETMAETITVPTPRGNRRRRRAKPAADQSPSLCRNEITPMPGAAAVAIQCRTSSRGANQIIHYTKPCEGVEDVTLPVNSITQPRVLQEAPVPPPPGKIPPGRRRACGDASLCRGRRVSALFRRS